MKNQWNVKRISKLFCCSLSAIMALTMIGCSGGDDNTGGGTPSTGTSDTPALTEREQRIESVVDTIKNYEQISSTDGYVDYSPLNGFKLGAYFWYGFSYDGDHYTKRLKEEFSDREPVFGWIESGVENMEEQIAYAVAGGISYFAFDWYYAGKIDQTNKCLDYFVEAENSDEMEFCINVCNHEGAFVNLDNWDYAKEIWLEYMKEDNYLTVNNKPVIMFLSSFFMSDSNTYMEEGKLVQGGLGNQIAAKFNEFNEDCKKLGYDGVEIIGTEVPYTSNPTRAIDFYPEGFDMNAWLTLTQQRKAQGFSALTGYNYRRYNPINGSYCVQYTQLAKDHQDCWDRFADANYPYVPCILGGWDNRPWETQWSQNTTGWRSCYAADRTPADVYRHILNAGKFLVNNPQCRVGDENGVLAVIYAWNENCEGGYICPTKGDDGRMLGAVRQAIRKLNCMEDVYD